MYLLGLDVFGPSDPSRCRILTARLVCSQSSMNSHRCASPFSLASGFSSMMPMTVSAIEVLYSSPPSSLSIEERKLSRMPCFLGNFRAKDLMAWTTTTLNSSEISETKVAIWTETHNQLPKYLNQACSTVPVS